VSSKSTKTDLDTEVSSSSSTSTSTSSLNKKATSSSNVDWLNMFKNHNLPIQGGDFQNPRQLLGHLIPTIDITKLPANLDDFDICRLIYQLMSSTASASDGCDSATSSFASAAVSSLFLVQREKQLDFNTLEQCIDMIDKAQNIIVLTGAGCSVSCGIPDFRSRDGVYARLRVDFPDLPDPQAMFDILYFDHDPRPFFKFAKEIYPGQFKPSLSHKFIKKIEDHGKLLRNYTQNIDTLEMAANIKNAILCHGSFATASCTVCKLKVDSEFIREKIFNQEIPYCEKCKSNNELEQNGTAEEEATSSSFGNTRRTGILKPDIVFFGEGLPEVYHESINEDKLKCDLLIVIGSSLKVKPVANIPHLLPAHVPQILINRESLKHMNFDVELLGDCDGIVNELLLRLDEKCKKTGTSDQEWSNICSRKEMLTQISDQEAEELFFNNSSENTKKLTENTTNEACTSTNETMEATKVEPCKKYTKDFLKDNSFLHLKPNMYIFHGAEVSLKNAKKKLKRLRKKLNMSDELASSSESDENVQLTNTEGKKSKHSYLSEIFKNPQNGLDEDEDDDEFNEDFSDDDTDSDSSDESDDLSCDNDDDDDDGGEEENIKNINEINSNDDEDDENDEDFSIEKNLNKKNLADFISENIEKTLTKKE
jgi:NAD+-dependent protein deacetylase sirtuin 1